MRFIKLGLISVFVLFFIFTAISLLIPSTIVVSRSVKIRSTPAEILPIIRDLTQWPAWISDSGTAVTTSAPRPGEPVGSIIIGQTVVELLTTDTAEVRTRWRTNKGRSMEASFYLLPHDDSSQSTLQWRFVQQLKWYPWEKFSSIASEKVLGPYIDNKLNRIKLIVEEEQ